MIRKLAVLASLWLAAGVASAQPASTSAPGPVEVMVLGTYHFGNPGEDLANAKIDPVTTPIRQRELQSVARAIARFRPTIVAVERVAPDKATLIDPYYAGFTPGVLLTNPDERVQIGYRIANDAGLKTVHAIDVQPEKGEASFFPFEDVQRWAEGNGRKAQLEALIAKAGANAKWIEREHRRRSIGSLLAEINLPNSPIGAGSHGDFYYDMMPYAGPDGMPGAELNARWYLRNARIFARLAQVAKPGDRVLVVYGVGHNYWLRHFAGTTPGYRLVEASSYLRR